MADEVMAAGGFKPPYMAFQTFWNFMQEMSEHDLPPVIDRSLMGSKSGTDQANLLGALKAFELISADNRVQPGLAEITNSDAEIRKLALEELVKKFYEAALAVSARNGTQAQLLDCFRDAYGVTGADTLRKATSFFLQACRMADIAVSPHFKATRATSAGGSKSRKPRKSKAGNGNGEDAPPIAPPNPEEHRVSVALLTGGTMTLSVSVNPLSLRGDDRAFFYDIVDKLTDYQEKAAHKNSRTSATEEAE